MEFPTAEEIAALIVVPEVNMSGTMIPNVVTTKVESIDNKLLNEFLESEFRSKFSEIENFSKEEAEKELRNEDDEVVSYYLQSILESSLDKDTIEVTIDDIDVEVTELGLGEDEDKCAIVAFELEVEYELEEGVRVEFEKDMTVVYEVCFEEGNFLDEEVNLILIE
jgi:hypothetical protein